MASAIPPSTTLFDFKERTRLRPAGYAEPSYTFFNESARPECAHIREQLEHWFLAYPAGRKDELRRLLQSTSEPDFVGAFFELYCYTLLSRQGFTAEVHPFLPNGITTHPDFKVQMGDRPVCYFECAVARGRDPETDWRINLLIDDLNRLQSKNFTLCLEIWGTVPKANPPIKDIRRGLKQWLDSLNPDAVMAKIMLHGSQSAERYVFQGEGWHLVFSATPLSKAMRGVANSDMRLIGSSAHFGVSSFVDAQQPLLKTLSDKGAGRYGELGLPYVVAVNVRGEPADEWGIRSALFGHYAVSRTEGSVEWMLVHMRDGFWMAPKGPRNTRVSAVLITSLLEPFRMANAQLELWHNPFAARPLDRDWWSGPQVYLDLTRGELIRQEGLLPYQLLGIDPEWPFMTRKERQQR